MYELKTFASFDSAHFLAGYHGKCANLHGHHWKIEVVAGCETLQKEGVQRDMILDFADMKQALRNLAESYDHALIYEEGSLQLATVEALLAEGFRLIAVPFRPTAEQFAKCFYEKLQNKGFPVLRVIVYETPDNCAGYEVR